MFLSIDKAIFSSALETFVTLAGRDKYSLNYIRFQNERSRVWPLNRKTSYEQINSTVISILNIRKMSCESFRFVKYIRHTRVPSTASYIYTLLYIHIPISHGKFKPVRLCTFVNSLCKTSVRYFGCGQ